MKAIMKYRSHPSSKHKCNKEKRNSNLCFSFPQTERDEIIKEISNFKVNRATQSTDILPELIQENSDIFADFIFENLFQKMLSI